MLSKPPLAHLLFALLALALVGARLHAEEPVEYRVKAGCLYKFLQFVEWPADSFKDKDSPFVIGVLGDNPFGDLLDQTVHDRKIDGRKIVVRRYRETDAAKEAHVLFVSLKGDQLAKALKALAGEKMLTVGENVAFIESGGIVRFAIRDEKVAFDINSEAGKKAGLKIGAQLLRLARVVNDKGE